MGIVMKDRETGRSRGFGFVTYDNASSVDMVMDRYEDHRILDKWVEVKRATPQAFYQSARIKLAEKFWGGYSPYGPAPAGYAGYPGYASYGGMPAYGAYGGMAAADPRYSPYGGCAAYGGCPGA